EAAPVEIVPSKRQQMPTELVVLEDLLPMVTGGDDAAKLKRDLHAAWRQTGLHYVLLVGDADVMPVRYMVLDRCTKEAFDYAFYPSDLYYADLAKSDGSFETWNAQHDDFHAGYFGEVRGEKNKTDPINYDQIDYKPEIAVGRWPVSTPDEVRIVAAKSMEYEKLLASRDRVARTAALVAISGWVESRSAMDAMAAKLPVGWS